MFDNNIPGKNGPKHTLGTSKERRNTTKKIKAPSDPRGTKQSRGRRADEPQGGIYTKITGKHSNKCFVHIGECMFFLSEYYGMVPREPSICTYQYAHTGTPENITT